MSPVQIARRFLPPIIIDGIRWLRNTIMTVRLRRKVSKDLQVYLKDGIPAWSPDYEVYRQELICKTLTNPTLLACFRQGELLPVKYGVGFDERCVEFPWLMVNLHDQPERLLDAGSTFNLDFIVNQPILQRKKIHILTLAPESNCFWNRGISYLFHDLRDIPIQDNYYDTVVCMSTLEHVGYDNTLFTEDNTYQEHQPDDYLTVMQELRRVVKTGGVLLLTVPFGRYQELSAFQQFDHQLLRRAIEAFGPADVTETFYRYTADGWQIAKAADCATCEYVVSAPWLRAQSPGLYAPEPDLAVAARSVACIRMAKR